MGHSNLFGSCGVVTHFRVGGCCWCTWTSCPEPYLIPFDNEEAEKARLRLALVHSEDEVGAAIMLVHVLPTHSHMVRGMGVEVAGTEHIATAGFDITRCHVEIRFGRFLLRRRGKIDEACSQRKERKQEELRQTTHDPSNRFIENGGPTGNCPTLLSEYGGFNWISFARQTGTIKLAGACQKTPQLLSLPKTMRKQIGETHERLPTS